MITLYAVRIKGTNLYVSGRHWETNDPDSTPMDGISYSLVDISKGIYDVSDMICLYSNLESASIMADNNGYELKNYEIPRDLLARFAISANDKNFYQPLNKNLLEIVPISFPID